jgi:hypothetical protein
VFHKVFKAILLITIVFFVSSNVALNNTITLSLSKYRNTTSSLNAKSILDEMIIAIKKINTSRYKLHTTERIDGKLLFINSEIKLNTKPRKIYLKNPSKNLELLFVENENNGDAIVNPGKFPYVTLYLNPNKHIMRKNQHHSIDDLGFPFIAQMISRSFPTNTADFHKTFGYTGDADWEGKKCHKIYAEFKDFKVINYTLTKDETVNEISYKFNCGDYRIIEFNENYTYGETIKKGTTIKLPNMYASKTLMYIDVQTKLPIALKIFDNGGLYESYEFRDIVINKAFDKEEFLKDFKDYKFK